jgi:elongation factor 1-beta
MARMVVTLKIMPDSPDTNLDAIETKAKHKIAEFGGDVGKVEIEPIAFGLKALKIYFIMDESIGSTESLEENIAKVSGVSSVETFDVRRTIG